MGKEVKKKEKTKSKKKIHATPLYTMGGGSDWEQGSTAFEADVVGSVSRKYNKKTGKVTETFKRDGKTIKIITPIGQMKRKGEKFFEPSLPRKTKKKGGKLKLMHGGKAPKKKYGVVGKPSLKKGGKV